MILRYLNFTWLLKVWGKQLDKNVSHTLPFPLLSSGSYFVETEQHILYKITEFSMRERYEIFGYNTKCEIMCFKGTI